MPQLAKYLTTRQHRGNCCPSEHPPACCPEHLPGQTIVYAGYDLWLPELRILAPHLPDNILLALIRQTVIDFARQSTILRRCLSLNLQAGVCDYYPCLDGQERIEHIRTLVINGQSYRSSKAACTWQIEDYRYDFQPPDTLVVQPAPCRQQTLFLSLTAVPGADSVAADRLIYDRHFAAIAAGAAAQAALIPAQEDNLPGQRPHPESYTVHRLTFTRGIQRAKLDIARRYAREQPLWSET